MEVERRFTQTGIIFPAGSLAKEMFKSSSPIDRPNYFLSLHYGHVVISAAAVGPSPAASVSASKNRSSVDFGSALSHLPC